MYGMFGCLPEHGRVEQPLTQWRFGSRPISARLWCYNRLLDADIDIGARRQTYYR